MLHGAEFNVSLVPAQRIFPEIKPPATKGILASDGDVVHVAGAMAGLLDAKFLFASLIWGSIGAGYFIYGKKQQAMMPMIGGVAMVAVSYLVSSWFWMSLACLVLIAGVYWLMRQGY